ncbi:uncharacterized protein EI90DRAFT_1871631 [Cantharellus anzutake]|uniref:uncharacterized protein n=1 Tax=Cantharellus anzutake TaxID=1750568 RepID=UPI001904F912|nr:uncharacterized protein EI90DRAFT_1871631 [Cantharellus anzutake]KAF8326802.1 hypothetical protein EI90DRAFT_1871631 [Cantharellus anzutake]
MHRLMDQLIGSPSKKQILHWQIMRVTFCSVSLVNASSCVFDPDLCEQTGMLTLIPLHHDLTSTPESFLGQVPTATHSGSYNSPQCEEKCRSFRIHTKQCRSVDICIGASTYAHVLGIHFLNKISPPLSFPRSFYSRGDCSGISYVIDGVAYRKLLVPRGRQKHYSIKLAQPVQSLHCNNWRCGPV